METNNLQIPFSGDAALSSTSERRFVHLEQIKSDDDPNKTATMQDISQMIARAKGGVSAKTYLVETDCPYKLTNTSFETWFDFYAWPNRIDLPHTITSALGNISNPEIVRVKTTFNVLFKETDVVELDFILEDIQQPNWDGHCYKPDGSIILTPVTLTMDGKSTIRSSEKVFGIAEISGYKVGAKHRLTQTLHIGTPTDEAVRSSATVKINEGSAGYDVEYTPTVGDTLLNQKWTFEFINGSAYNVVGDEKGQMFSGDANNDFTCSYFSVKKEFFTDTGSYTDQDYISFTITVEGEETTEESLYGFTDIVEWDAGNGNPIEEPDPLGAINLTGISIENLNTTVTATWTDLDGEDESHQLTMSISTCVKDAMNMCDSYGESVNITHSSDPSEPQKPRIYYYSICDGSIVGGSE